MPRNKEQNEQIRKERKETIMRGALKVYVEKGYAAAEIGDVAQRAGVARGLVYYYFKDKLTLFRELFHFMFEQSRNHVQSHFAREGSVRLLFEKFAYSMCANMLEQSDTVLFFIRMRHDLHELFTAEELRAWNWHLDNMNVIRAMMKKGMEAGEIRPMSPDLLAAQYWGAMMHGMMHFRQLHKELKEQGMIKEEMDRQIRRDMEDAVAGCMALISPPGGGNSNGVGDK